MSSKKSTFPICKVLFFIFLTLAAIVSFDVYSHGSFKASSSGRFAKDIGVYTFLESAIKHSTTYYNHAYNWSVKNVPVYYKIAVESSRPYIILLLKYASIAFEQVKQSLNVMWNYILEKLPFVTQWIETYAPVLAKKEIWSNVFDNVAHYSKIFLELCLTVAVEALFYFGFALETSVTWLQSNVFTGSLSSENLQKYAVQGIDTAFSCATKAIFWIRETFVSIYG